MEYAWQEDGKTPVFSVLTYGIKGPSISGGLGAVLNLSVRPVIDQKELPGEWATIKSENPNAKIAVIAPNVAFMDLILGSALFDKIAATQVRTLLLREEIDEAAAAPTIPEAAAEAIAPEDNVTAEYFEGTVTSSDDTVTIIQDPSIASATVGAQVGAYQVFAISLTPDAGAIFATNGGENASNFGVRYRYTVSGIRTRVKAEITVDWKRLYEHIHEEAGGGWFSFKGRHAVDLQKLKETGGVTLKILEGAFESDSDQFETIYNTLVTAHLNGEKLFKPTLTSTPPPGAPSTSGSFFGWSFSGAWSYQKLEEEKNFTYTIDRQIIGEKTFQIGMGFQGMCSKYPDLFVAQGVNGPGCIEAGDIAAAAARYETLKGKCDLRGAEERKSLYSAIALLPNLDLQKIALEDASESVAASRFECIQGK